MTTAAKVLSVITSTRRRHHPLLPATAAGFSRDPRKSATPNLESRIRTRA